MLCYTLIKKFGSDYTDLREQVTQCLGEAAVVVVQNSEGSLSRHQYEAIV